MYHRTKQRHHVQKTFCTDAGPSHVKTLSRRLTLLNKNRPPSAAMDNSAVAVYMTHSRALALANELWIQFHSLVEEAPRCGRTNVQLTMEGNKDGRRKQNFDNDMLPYCTVGIFSEPEKVSKLSKDEIETMPTAGSMHEPRANDVLYQILKEVLKKREVNRQ